MAQPKPTILDCAKLLESVEQVLADHRKRWEDQWARYKMAQDDLRTEWVEKYSEAWADAAKKIARAVKRGEPITADILPGSSASQVEVFREDRFPRVNGTQLNPPSDVYTPPADVLTLKHALHVHSEPVITPSGLGALGVTRATLRDAVQAMGRLQAEQQKSEEKAS